MSEVIRNLVKEYSDREEIGLTDAQLSALEQYASMLVKTNEVMNLTNITDDEGIAVRHFIDSLTLVPYIREEQKQAGRRELSVIDVGTGAGFPGLVLKIAMPELRLTLLLTGFGGFDPSLALPDKSLDAPLGHEARSPDQNGAGRVHLHAHGPPIGADQLILYLFHN